jgi:Zn-dependent protease
MLPAMKWSFRIGRVFGIDVRVHATFALIVAYAAMSFGQLGGPRGAAFGVLLILGLFACVTLHELGHSLVAQRFGVQVREIILLPIGGVARLDSEPRKPAHELLIAIAGPLVNVAIAFGLALALHPGGAELKSGWYLDPEHLTFSARTLLLALLGSNALLAVFNMIPALPMDGGRVLRACLSFFVGKVRATSWAATVGQVIAVGMVVFGFETQQPMLALIGVLVFIGAAQERAVTRAAEALSDLRAGEVCDPNALTLAPSDPVGTVIDNLVRSAQAHYPVFYGKELVGIVSREQILMLVPRVGLQAPLSTLMRREFFAVDAGMPLDELRRHLIELGGRPVVVRSLTGYLGVLGLEDIQRIGLVAERLARAGIRRPQPVPDPALH